ncbi:MAG TPA: CapA family protein [Myxococcales bacterium]|nr:CapA family protein [Myxococcales bacterium]
MTPKAAAPSRPEPAAPPAETAVATAPVPEPPVTPAPAPRLECGAAGKELVSKGQAVQREKGEDGCDEAIALYKQALAGDPGCTEALWELGWSLQIKGDPAAAVDAWDQLKKLDPDYPGMADNYDAMVRRRDQAAMLNALPEAKELPPVDTRPADGPPLRIAAVGDVHMGRAWPAERAALPPDGAMHLYDAVKPSLQDADVTFGNLETVLADDGESQKCGKRSTKCFAFRVPTAFAAAVKDAGFDVMSIANNHAGDFGPKGRTDTMAALDKAGLKHSGPVGDIAYLEVDRGKDVPKQKIALVAFSFGADVYRIQELDIARRLVAFLARSHDLVFVSFHGGGEGAGFEHVPRGREKFLGEDRGDERAFAHTVIDAGADLVLGHGPHLLRGMERYKGRLIAYSMGNFSSWDTFGLNFPNNTTGVFHVTLAPNGVVTQVKVDPVVIEKPGTPVPDPDKKAIEILRKLSKDDFGDAFLREDGTWTLDVKAHALAAPPATPRG